MTNGPKGPLVVGLAQLSGRHAAAILANQPTPHNPDHLRACRASHDAETRASIVKQLRDLYALAGGNITVVEFPAGGWR